ncbi:unnamed protein product [Darwinula stevensoni]|uniref:CLIP domain-containing serine protease n=1 Tax=Darwinula stevensoni TaxID=69355 RepID=A0A7R9A214_9CRUS|nr:unnamed protein product [Darwinula stevensoni]CAG0878650.1 unnamed protein product [Darwinula stevensoni]
MGNPTHIDEECKTPEPNVRPGKCVNIRDCAELFSLIEGPEWDVEYLRQSVCSVTIDGNQSVCCPVAKPTPPPKENYSELTGGFRIPVPGVGVKPGCGGAVINKRYVITAAHCVSPEFMGDNKLQYRARSAFVRLGEHTLSTDPDCFRMVCQPRAIDAEVENVIYPVNFYHNSTTGAKLDIALIRLANDIDFETVQPNDGSDVLQQLKVPIVPLAKCAATPIYKTVELNEEHICAGGEPDRDSCKGDSGGPLVVLRPQEGHAQYFLIGVVSFGTPFCGNVDAPGVYTRITHYLDWILEHVVFPGETSRPSFVAEGSTCRTPPPQSSPGRCTTHSTCPEIQRLLQRRSDPAVNRLLTELRCGFNGNVPLFCCPLTTGNPQAVPPTVPSRPRNPPGVNAREYLRSICVEEGILQLKIFGGRKTQPGQFPWAVLLAYPSMFGGAGAATFDCGGTLISKRHVLTAAHCVIDRSLRLKNIAFVRVGEHDVSKEGESGHRDIRVRRAIPHPDYVGPPNFYNDIAIIVLQDELTFSDHIAPICMPVLGDRELLDRNAPLKVIGWGSTEKSSRGSEVLLQADVPVADDATCATGYQEFGIVFDGEMQLCAGGQQGTDTCAGDSGGAAMFLLSGLPPPATPKFVLGGVTSIGSTQCGTGLPGLYTRVQHYLPWITNNIQSDL